MENSLNYYVKNNIRCFYYKVAIVIDLLEQLRATGLEITFDNTITNHYKLKYNDGEYVFADYNGVISCLSLLLETKKGEEK
jgi:hypothetical protein